MYSPLQELISMPNLIPGKGRIFEWNYVFLRCSLLSETWKPFLQSPGVRWSQKAVFGLPCLQWGSKYEQFWRPNSEKYQETKQIVLFFEQRPALLFYMVSSLFIWLQVHRVTKTFQKRTFCTSFELPRLCIDRRATPREQDNEVMLGSSFYRWKWGSWRK